MTRYRIVQMLEVGPGQLVQLDEAQAKRRAHRLEHLGEGVYRTKEVLQFKAGEVVGLAAELPKVHQDRVVLIDDRPAEVPAATDGGPSAPHGWLRKKKS